MVAFFWISRARRRVAFACARLAVASSRCAIEARCAVSAASRRCLGSAPLSNRFFARSCSSTALASDASAVSSEAFATATAAIAASAWASISRRSSVAMVWPSLTASPMSTRICSSVPGSLGFTATRERGVSVPEISSDDSTSPTTAFTTGTSMTGAAAVVSGAASAVVDDSLQPAAASEETTMTTVRKRPARERRLRFMTTHSSGHLATQTRRVRAFGARGSRDAFCRALARHERGGDAGLQAGDGGVEHVARQRVVVFAGGEAMADADHGRPDERRPQHVHRAVGIDRGGEGPLVDRALNGGHGFGQHALQQLEALPLLRDARHRAVDEHQLEVGRLLLRELVKRPPPRAHHTERALLVGAGGSDLFVETMKAFLSQGKEDVVLAGEVTVDGRGAVFDALGDLANRHALVAFRYEEVAGGGEDRGRDGLPFTVLAFFCSHVLV